ncbi:MAG: hypothetical protein IKP40_08270 [Clostridia bacterium]|nr:hypothetical protein [Clostridia bacterium]
MSTSGGAYQYISGVIAENGGTVELNSGSVTGNLDMGVAIYDGSVLTLTGGTVTGGGDVGVYNSESTVIMNGGTVTGSDSNSDIYNLDADFTLRGGSAEDIYLDGTVITIDSALAPESCYHVSMSSPGVFTSGLSGRGTEANFVSADSAYGVAVNDAGEALLAPVDTIASYVDRVWNGSEVVSTTKTVVVSAVPSDGNMTSGWYCLNSNYTKDGRVSSITGDVNLILGDGYKLDVKGLSVPEGCTLTIYGQAAGTGELYSHPSSGAGIGGWSGNNNGDIVICGGTIRANGYNNCAGIDTNDGKTGGSITIYGGTVTATGGSKNCSGGHITIYGGTITAKGGSDGAAIGGGVNGDGGYITIKGGGENGAGIGGGDDADGGTITIWGGTITANEDPNEDGAGIGGGDAGDGGTIAIYGGTITTWSRDGAGIGGGDDRDGGNITITGGTITCWDGGHAQGARIGGGCGGDGGVITISGGTIDVYHRDGAGIGGGEDGDGGIIRISGGTVTTIRKAWATPLASAAATMPARAAISPSPAARSGRTAHGVQASAAADSRTRRSSAVHEIRAMAVRL